VTAHTGPAASGWPHTGETGGLGMAYRAWRRHAGKIGRPGNKLSKHSSVLLTIVSDTDESESGVYTHRLRIPAWRRRRLLPGPQYELKGSQAVADLGWFPRELRGVDSRCDAIHAVRRPRATGAVLDHGLPDRHRGW